MEPEAKAAVAVPFYRNPWVLAFVGGVVVITMTRPYCARRTKRVPKPPPVIGQIPAFSLINQEGQAFGSEQLAGQVYVVNFIFTRCSTLCPRMTEQMRKLQRRLDKGKVPVRLVSISVDPEFDTPAVFKAYATKKGADLKRWSFLTGPLPKVRALLEGGFKTHLGKKEKIEELVDIAHTSRFAIVDGTGGLRGFYASDNDGIDEVYHRSQHVLKEGRK